MTDGAVVFERRVGAVRLAALWLLALAVPLSTWVTFGWVVPRADVFKPLIDAFGVAPVAGSVTMLWAAPLVGVLVFAAALLRRCGRCVAGPDWLVFERALLPTWVGRTVVLRSEVGDRELRGDLVRVRLQGRRNNLYFVVPASTQAELEAVLLELDRAVEVEPVAAGRRHRARDRWLEVSVVAVMQALAIATVLVLDRRLGEGWALPSYLSLTAFTLPLMLCLSAARAAWIRRVYVGRHGLAVGEELFTWDELTLVGVGEGYLTCAAGSRTCVAWIGVDEGQVRDAIAGRLLSAGRLLEDLLGPLPASETRWRRRARRLLLAAPALLVPVGALIAACVVPNYEMLSRADDAGRMLCVMYAHDGDRPGVIVLITSDRGPLAFRTAGWWPQTLSMGGPSTTVDLPPGATFVHVSESGVASSSPAWAPTAAYSEIRRTGSWVGPLTKWPKTAPERLAEFADGVDDPAVRAALLTR